MREIEHCQNCDTELPEQIKRPLDLVREFTLPFLREGRGGYNLPHTQAVDYYAAILSRVTGQDELALRTAAWLHDVGDYDVERSPSYSREIHMDFSVLRAREFFNQLGISQCYKREQIDRIIHIIRVHDNIDALVEKDVLTFMEADVLGGLATNTHRFSNFNQAMAYTFSSLHRKLQLFRTDTGKQLLIPLLARFYGELAILPH